jgi:3-oxoacyl-[acyl-carrier protein] reductase
MNDGGCIVSIGSCLAHRVPTGGVTLYAMNKAALVGFTKGLARDVGLRGITVNLVDPGPTATDMNPAEGPGADGERALTALGRYARPEDVAAMVAYLAGDGGRFVTGAALAVDGGYAA